MGEKGKTNGKLLNKTKETFLHQDLIMPHKRLKNIFQTQIWFVEYHQYLFKVKHVVCVGRLIEAPHQI